VLDCKVEADQAIIDALPSILDHLCGECAGHFATVKDLLTARGIAFEVKPRLVRGLDYYTKTTFEFVHGALGAQSAVCGGGRYDGLAESLGSRVAAPGIGFSIGEDRLVMTIEEARAGRAAAGPDLFIAPMGKAATKHAAVLARDLRREGLVVEVSADKKLKRALETANKTAARWTLILGDDELARGDYSLKAMASGEQKSVRREEIAPAVRG
jgi:histidyl-tRNA synthetase